MYVDCGLSSIICVLVFTSTFVPKGAFALNPKMLSEDPLDTDLDDEDLEYVPGPQVRNGKQSHESHEMVSRANSS